MFSTCFPHPAAGSLICATLVLWAPRRTLRMWPYGPRRCPAGWSPAQPPLFIGLFQSFQQHCSFHPPLQIPPGSVHGGHTAGVHLTLDPFPSFPFIPSLPLLPCPLAGAAPAIVFPSQPSGPGTFSNPFPPAPFPSRTDALKLTLSPSSPSLHCCFSSFSFLQPPPTPSPSQRQQQQQ